MCLSWGKRERKRLSVVAKGKKEKEMTHKKIELQGPPQLMYHHLHGLGLQLLEYFTSSADLLFLRRS